MIDWNEFKKCLKNDAPEYIANKELAQMIVRNEPKAVHYYLTEIGIPIMKHIEFSIMHRDITADYYIFLSSPYDKQEEKPLWHRVDLYKGINCLLSSYTSNIACRHFYKLAAKERCISEKECGLLEYVDYESLIKCESISDDEDDSQLLCVRKAFQMLSERYRLVLHYLVIEKMSALDAFPLLDSYIHPRAKNGLTSDEVKQTWTNKQRQDALSLLKGYALKHLQENFESIKNNLNC
ncbi:hypothetical protein [Bacteroides sp.]|uniref:hypothetical protein n=1 Tax=Bacteroides sp. TaxID=29523 RepID=UPI002585BAAE|nr:hypothetical protein [Bacteroides sp.]